MSLYSLQHSFIPAYLLYDLICIKTERINESELFSNIYDIELYLHLPYFWSETKRPH